MALVPVLHEFTVELNLADRGESHRLVLRPARHPSETLERLWLRVLAFAFWYEERLEFGPGLSTPDAPDLLARDLTGNVTLWIRVGKADPEDIRRAIDHHRDARVVVLFESRTRLDQFLEGAEAEKVRRLDRAELVAVDPAFLSSLAEVEARRVKVTLTVVGDHVYADRQGTTIDAPLERAHIG
jgi:uncharacterized protein YaeQ